jgi:hypothetical protein
VSLEFFPWRCDREILHESTLLTSTSLFTVFLNLLQVLDLRWGEPLLRLASDVSRGMAYLHGREYLDETDQNKMKRCILHRDLKVAFNRL